MVEMQTCKVPVLAPAGLILLKQGSWREKDQFDVAAMRGILNKESP
jgi:hypothetical protein